MTDGKLFRLKASRLDKEGECLILLPVGFRDVLLDGTYRLLWGATWLEDDYATRAILTDAQKDLIELGISRLIDCVDIQVTNNVTTNCGGCSGSGSGNNDIINVDCGGGGGTVDIPVDSPIGGDGSDVIPDDLGGGHLDPSEPLPDGLSDGGFDTWNDYDSYVCDFSHYVPTALNRVLLGLETATDKLTTVAGVLSVIAYLFPQAWAAKAGAASLWELVTAISELVVGETAFDSLADLAGDIMSEPLYSELVCIVYSNRYHLPIAHSKLLLRISQQISSYAWSGEMATKVLNYVDKTIVTRWLYSEMLTQVLGKFDTGNDCSSCEPASGGDILIDLDTLLPPPDWNILDTTEVIDDGGNLVFKAVAHQSGNNGGGGWNSSTILGLVPADTMTIYRIEVDVKNEIAENDDDIAFHFGYDDEYEVYTYNGSLFSQSWSQLGWDVNLHFDIADGARQGLGFICLPHGQRQPFHLDNIRIYYA